MKNSELLAWSGPSHLLRSIDRQRQYVLQIEAVAKACPNCGTKMTVWEGRGVLDVDDYDLNVSYPDLGRCLGCNREIRFTLPLFGGDWHWSLVPVLVVRA